MALFSSAMSAYIRLSLAFSTSSSFRRFNSDAPRPPYLVGRTDAVLAADLFHRQARLRHVQDQYDLGFRELGSFHGTSPHWLIVPNFYLGVVYLRGKFTDWRVP